MNYTGGSEVVTEFKFSDRFHVTICTIYVVLNNTYKWSCRLNAFEHIPQTYFLSSLWVNLCLARAEALPNTLLQTCE